VLTLADLPGQMEQMAAEFGSMLEETLKKMTSRIQLNSESYDDEEGMAEKKEEGDLVSDEN